MTKSFSKIFKMAFSFIIVATTMIALAMPALASDYGLNVTNGERIYAALSAEIDVNGTKVTLPAENLADAKKWLDTNNSLISDTQTVTTLGAINQAREYVASEGILRIEDANTVQRTKLLQLGNQAGNGLGLKVAFNAVSDQIYVEDATGEHLSTYQMNSGNGSGSASRVTSNTSNVTNYTNTTNPIKQTGVNSTNFWIIVGVFAILAIVAVIVGKRFHVFKK